MKSQANAATGQVLSNNTKSIVISTNDNSIFGALFDKDFKYKEERELEMSTLQKIYNSHGSAVRLWEEKDDWLNQLMNEWRRCL